MLKHILKRPTFWSLLALAVCAGWHWRPLDRSALFPVQFADGKYGYVNENGRVAVPGVWDNAYSFAADGRALVKREDKYGFINREGNLFAPLGKEVSQLRFWQGKMGVISNSGQFVSWLKPHVPLWKYSAQKKGLRQRGIIIVDPVWDDIEPFDAANLAAVQKDGKWGFIDRNQKLVIPLEWDSAKPFAKNQLACVGKAERFGFIDCSGKLAIPLEWKMAFSFNDNGRAFIIKDEKVGFIDHSGKIVIPLEYDSATEFDHRGMAKVQTNKRHGFIHANGNAVIPLQWDDVTPFDDVPLPARSDTEIIDQDGNSLSPHSDEAKSATDIEGLARVQKNGKWGCINRRGKITIETEWDAISPFDTHGLARIEQDEKHGLINRKGELVIPPIWDAALNFDNKHMAMAVKGDKFGYVDRTGIIVIPIDWDRAGKGNFLSAILDEDLGKYDSKDMAIVKRDKKYGYIDRAGKTIFPFIYNHARAFDAKDMAVVFRDKGYGVINRVGELVIAPNWEYVEGFRDDDRTKVMKEKKLGFINRKGEIVIPPEWDGLAPLLGDDQWLGKLVRGTQPRRIRDSLTPDVLEVRKDERRGYIDWTGNIIVAPEWTDLLIRTDAGSERCCFVVSRSVEDGLQPGWMKTARDWLLALIGRAGLVDTQCHLVATDGRLLWSSDWLSSEARFLALAAIAGLALTYDGFAIWRRRRRERIAAMTPSATMK